MRHRFGRPSIPQLLLVAVPVVALVVGIIVPGGTGDTIAAIAGAVLALVLIARFGVFHQPQPRRYPPGDEREREPTEYGPPRPPGWAGGLR
ncbi:MAG TPA: hypothetical protein VN522_04935 [Solirubrobacterales bacterium]|nr:hypothetical protein [Solirubrobacterales bacterium]